MEQIIPYYENMVRLQKQGVPLDWQAITANIIAIITAQETETQESELTKGGSKAKSSKS